LSGGGLQGRLLPLDFKKFGALDQRRERITPPDWGISQRNKKKGRGEGKGTKIERPSRDRNLSFSINRNPKAETENEGGKRKKKESEGGELSGTVYPRTPAFYRVKRGQGISEEELHSLAQENN